MYLRICITYANSLLIISVTKLATLANNHTHVRMQLGYVTLPQYTVWDLPCIITQKWALCILLSISNYRVRSSLIPTTPNQHHSTLAQCPDRTCERGVCMCTSAYTFYVPTCVWTCAATWRDLVKTSVRFTSVPIWHHRATLSCSN